jgi:hypothetical protein
MLPEEKLPYLRNVLLEGTFAEGNDLLQGREPFADNVFQTFKERYTALNSYAEGFGLTYEKLEFLLAPHRRRYVEMFDEEFGPLLARLPLTRSLSAAGQTRYSGTAGKRKRIKRKTRRNRS